MAKKEIWYEAKTKQSYKHNYKSLLLQYFIPLVPMTHWLHKILFIAISISFFISATEMDIGEVHNTFFDEYDTYVKSEQVTVDQTSIAEPQPDAYALSHAAFLDCKVLGHQQAIILQPSVDYYNHYPPKLFLRNCVWRI